MTENQDRSVCHYQKMPTYIESRCIKQPVDTVYAVLTFMCCVILTNSVEPPQPHCYNLHYNYDIYVQLSPSQYHERIKKMIHYKVYVDSHGGGCGCLFNSDL